MQDIFGLIKNIIIWGLLTFVFACIGFFTETPAIMVPLYGVVFLLALGIMYFFVSQKKVKTLDEKETPRYVFIIITAIGFLLSLLAPTYLLSVFRPSLFNSFAVIGFTVLLLVLGFVGVYLINVMGLKGRLFAIIGFIVLIITSFIPAFTVSSIDPSFGTLGVIYFVTLLDAVFAWETFELVKKVISG